MDKTAHILFRSSDLTQEEELEIAQKYFPCSRLRSQTPSNSLVIARYSALPFYDELLKDLETKNSVLINDLKQHNWIASFDWYHDLKDVTPQTWFDHDFYQCTDPGPFVVKGRTNSRKHQWNRLMFAPTKKDASVIASELMSDPLINEQGIVYRKYIPLRLHEKCPVSGLPYSHEFRCFFYKTELLSFGYYWSLASEPHKPAISATGIEFAKQVARRAAEHATFFVLDIAEIADKPDEWILIEINDGQQAGPSECDLNMLYSGLADALAGKSVHGSLKPPSIRPIGHQMMCPGRPGGPWGGQCNCGFSSWGKPFAPRVEETKSFVSVGSSSPLFLKELMNLSPEESAKKLKEFLVHESKPEVRAQRKETLHNQLKAFEKKYGFSSAEMRIRLKTMMMPETSETCDWSISADLWEQAYGPLP